MEKIKILIADDSSLMRDIIKETVSEAFPFVQAFTANSGDEAQKMLLNHHFHLMLCDWEMPGLNGNELLKWVRESSGHKDIPVIMITAKGEKESVVEVMKLGISDYIVKPFTPDRLCHKIKNVLKNMIA